MVVAPHKVLVSTTQDVFLALMQRKLGLGEWVSRADGIWKWNDSDARVFFRSSDTPENLEGAHVGWIWMDEFGQEQFPEKSWAALKRRRGFFDAPVLGTTTPYVLHWILELWDKAATNRYFAVTDLGKRAAAVEEMRVRRDEEGFRADWSWLTETVEEVADGDRDVEVIRFPSIANPNYPMKTFEWARDNYSDWEFRMFYLAEKARSAGLVFGEILEQDLWVDMLPIEAQGQNGGHPWPRYAGVDFGTTNPTAVVYGTMSPEGVLYLDEEFYRKDSTDMENAKDAQRTRVMHAWGDPSARGGIETYRRMGWNITSCAKHEVRVGISEVISRAKQGKLKVVRNACPMLERELQQYLWDPKHPEQVIKERDHGPDAMRYMVMGLRRRNVNRLSRPIYLWRRPGRP